MDHPSTRRHRTAMERTDISRPIRQAMQDGVLRASQRLLDYGCGHGGDVRRLRQLGYEVQGWDPVHAPRVALAPADVVNLGYVVNVIEDPRERAETLRTAWSLTEGLLVVSARLKDDHRRCRPSGVFEDGVLTGSGTFQKFYLQTELAAWVNETLGAVSVAAAPGILYLFREDAEKERFLVRRYGRRVQQPRRLLSHEKYERHQDLLAPLAEFYTTRGRLPQPGELACSDNLIDLFGSVPSAFALVRRVTDPSAWDRIAESRRHDLLVYLALGRLSGRSPLTSLPIELQHDIRAHFGAYTRACKEADELLFSAGDKQKIGAACRSSKVGKQTPTALYVHVEALPLLDPVLRVYEGCARSFLGTVEDANVLKLHRFKSQVSYLTYPAFEREPHPEAAETVVANLDEFRIFYRRYSDSENPPILHRKEELVAPDHPDRQKWERLTAQEEASGLFEDTDAIGYRKAWKELLEAKGLYHRGHRLCRYRAET